MAKPRSLDNLVEGRTINFPRQISFSEAEKIIVYLANNADCYALYTPQQIKFVGDIHAEGRRTKRKREAYRPQTYRRELTCSVMMHERGKVDFEFKRSRAVDEELNFDYLQAKPSHEHGREPGQNGYKQDQKDMGKIIDAVRKGVEKYFSTK